MEDICARVGFCIRELREKKNLSQEQLANLADLHRAYVGQIERGEKNIGLRNLERIAKVLKVNLRKLVKGSFHHEKRSFFKHEVRKLQTNLIKSYGGS